MGQVVLKVNGRDFVVSCADGQEGRLRRLAQYVDAKAGEFAKTLGQVGEARLILLAALAIADELADANALQEERGRAGDVPANEGPSEAATRATVSGLDSIVERIESIAARIETP